MVAPVRKHKEHSSYDGIPEGILGVSVNSRKSMRLCLGSKGCEKPFFVNMRPHSWRCNTPRTVSATASNMQDARKY